MTSARDLGDLAYRTTVTTAGNININANTLFVDNVNNLVGIGTTSPAAKLDIVGNIKASGTVVMGSSFRRNKIINGGMAVDQRNAGASQTFTAGAALAYSVDRWYGYCTGADVTGARVAGSGINQYRYQFTGAASVTAIGFGQRIEAINSYDLNNGTATFSVDLANSLLTTVTWTAYYASTTDTFGTLAIPTRTQIATGTFTVTSTVTNYSASISVPSAATTGIEIVLTVGAQTSGTWTIGNVQLEAGSIATPFERLSIGETLALCQRYWVRTMSHMQTPAAGAMLISIYFPVEMRITPSASNSTAGGVSGTMTITINPRSTKTAYFQFSGTIAAGNYAIDVSTSFSAEL